MAVLASLMGAWLPRMPARPRLSRPPSRLAVLTWTLAFAAAGGTMASSFLSPDYGVSALVTTGPADASAKIQPHNAPFQTTLIDPAEFRRPAPPPDGRPRIAVIVRGLGLSKAETARAITDLPADVTLALNPYGRDLQHDADSARGDGHEVFLDIPVEPKGYPANDAGPEALLTSLSAGENTERLHWALGRFIGFPGLVFAPGTPALESAATLSPLFDGPALQGLVWAHAAAKGFDAAKVDTVTATISLEAGASADDVDRALERLEGAASKDGSAIAIVSLAPVMLERLKVWTATLEGKGIMLVPASALAVRPAS